MQSIAVCRPGSAQNWSRKFPVPGQHNVLATRTLCCLGKFCWSHQVCPHQVCTVWYSMRAMLLGPNFRCQLNGVLYFVLPALRGNIQWHLAISGLSMATIPRSNTSIPLMSHMTRTRFSMSMQWWALYCANCTAWETMTHLLITSIQFRPISWCHAPIL